MRKLHWLLAAPLVVAASLVSAHASSIRDTAGLFDPDVVRQAEAKLNQIERDSKVTTTIETINSLQGEPLGEVSRRHAERSGTEGIFILIPKEDHKFEILVSRPFRNTLTVARQTEIRNAFVTEFKNGDFDSGLRRGVDAIENEVTQAKAASGGVLRQAVPRTVPMRGPVRVQPAARGSSGLGTLLMIGLVILAVLFVIRLLGSLLGGGARGGYPGQRPMGGGPGYGAPGYGGGGGGFWSSMFGGIGGAMAGNWLYDQFSGRHHGGSMDNASYGQGDTSQPADTGGSDWSGGGVTGDWGGGGGDAGGGGDWGGGGGGGDWGGGGGDGGGGGGGDW